LSARRLLPPVLIAVIASLLLLPGAAGAQNVPHTIVMSDAVGDSGYAPDIGDLGSSVAANGALRTLTIGTTLSRGDLNEGDVASWQIDTIFTRGVGEPTYGGEYLVYIVGHDDAPDRWSTWRWADGQWNSFSLGLRLSVAAQQIVWSFDLGGSSPANPKSVGVRAITSRTSGTSKWVDVSPEPASQNMSVSLEALDPPGVNPVAGCTFGGGCVGGASGLGVSGPGADQPVSGAPSSGPPSNPTASSGACASARRTLASVRRSLARAKARQRRARTRAQRRSAARSVRLLLVRRATYLRLVRNRC
jgi:hypothetical protein